MPINDAAEIVLVEVLFKSSFGIASVKRREDILLLSIVLYDRSHFCVKPVRYQ